MKGTFTVIKADGSITNKPVVVTPEYEQIKAGLDQGMLETVPYFTRWQGEQCVAFVDEEGKLKGLPVNETASLLWYQQCPQAYGRDHLVGSVVIVSGDYELLDLL